MRPYRHISLSEIDLDVILNGIKLGKTHNFRERCRAIYLSDQMQTVPQIAFFLGKRCETIRTWFDNWEKKGLLGLKIQDGRGLKPVLDKTDMSLVVEIKKKNQRTTA